MRSWPVFVLLLSLAFPAFASLDSFAPIAEKALPAVVNVSTTQKIIQPTIQGFGIPGMPGIPNMPDGQQEELEQFFERFGLPFAPSDPQESEREVQSLGSGFVIDPDGYVVTNNHVVAEASEIVVIFSDDTKLKAKLIGRDPKTDLALLKIESDKPLPYVVFGDSDAMRVGDWVMAIGNPFGLGGTVTAGIISARSRNINAGPFDDFLQTDAAINRGNSGGPMFNLSGEVIGVNTAIFSPSGGNIGIGFAIPSAMAKPILEQLREFGRTHRGWLGVKIQHVTDEIAQSLGLPQTYGALVLELTEDSPAAKSGLEPGDVILSFDGKRIEEMRNLPRVVAETPVGQKVSLDIWRNGQQKTITLSLGEFPDEEEVAEPDKTLLPHTASKGDTVLGMKVVTLDDSLRTRLKLKKDAKGVVITSVDAKSEAAKRSLQAGDLIAGVNQRDIASVGELNKALNAARSAGRDFVLVRVIRGGSANYITLPLK